MGILDQIIEDNRESETPWADAAVAYLKRVTDEVASIPPKYPRYIVYRGYFIKCTAPGEVFLRVGEDTWESEHPVLTMLREDLTKAVNKGGD